MRLPVRRAALEGGLRLASLALLGFCGWAMTIARSPSRQVATGTANASLVNWTRIRPGTLHLSLKAAPSGLQRDWLRALAATGTELSWSGRIGPAAVEVLRSADPAGGRAVLVAGPAGTTIRLVDSLGVLDSAEARGAGASFALRDATGPLAAVVGDSRARAGVTDSVAVRHIAVWGRADWESRFVALALEERGWAVDVRLSVAPGISVRQGTPLPLDTARQAVVVALDSLSASDAAALQRFVASGGGAVMGPHAAASAASLAAGAVRARVAPAVLGFAAATPRRALALYPIAPRPDGVVLESQGRQVAVAARRVGAGRVVQIGYDETWRWRMAGAGDAAGDHRDWWARVVAAAAYQPQVGNRQSAIDDRDRAPLASLVEALGPAAAGPTFMTAGFDPRRLLPAAGLLLFLSLLGEWASRRLRGAS